MFEKLDNVGVGETFIDTAFDGRYPLRLCVPHQDLKHTQTQTKTHTDWLIIVYYFHSTHRQGPITGAVNTSSQYDTIKHWAVAIMNCPSWHDPEKIRRILLVKEGLKLIQMGRSEVNLTYGQRYKKITWQK